MKNFKVLFYCRIIAGACLFVAASTAVAQEIPSAQDLRALRYYVAQDETAAISAELRRLSIVFPDWTPPDDLAALEVTALTIPSTAIDNIYALIVSNDIVDARRELTATRAAFPDWVPPAEMLLLLATADAQANFDAAVTARDPDAALRIMLDEPTLSSCDRINTAWRLAELQEQTGNRAAALAAYRQIVGACSSISYVVATIEKASSVATEDELRTLIATAQQRIPTSRTTLNTLLVRLLAGRNVAAPSSAPPVVATPQPPVQHLHARTPTAAVVPGTSAVSPLAALRRSGDGRLGQVRASAQAGDFRTCTARSVSPRSLDVTYERAWCVYNLDRPLEALALFTAAAGGLSGAVARDARYGMALSMLKRNMTDAASRIAAATDLTQDQRSTIETTILDQRGVRSYQEENYMQAIIYFNGLEVLEGTLRRDLSILRAYAYLNSGDRATARTLFRGLNSLLSTAKTRAGLAAAGG
jgi:hypothetical protein